MTRDEVLGAVNAICFGSTDNSIISSLLGKLRTALPHSNISDLIFWNRPQLTPEQIVDEAMKREADYILKDGFGSN